MSKANLPTAEYLNECFRYENGKLFWRVRPLSHFKDAKAMNTCNHGNAGNEAGYLLKRDEGDRWRISINNKLYRRSRIVWAMHNGNWPKNLIDHENRITTDDRIKNLRQATHKQNACNSKLACDNKSGFKGVYMPKWSKKWRARITVDGKLKCLGSFETAKEAHRAYVAAAKDHFGEFAFFGLPDGSVGNGGMS